MSKRMFHVLICAGALTCSAGVAWTQPTPRLVDVGLQELNKYRPAISVFYYGGHPGQYTYGRDQSSDLSRIGAYLDAVGVDVAGIGSMGLPGDTNASAQLSQSHILAVNEDKKYGLGTFTHVYGGVPKWFSERYGGEPQAFIASGPKLMWIADPLFYQQVIDRYASEVIGSIPAEDQPDIWWLESEPGLNYVDYNLLKSLDCPLVIPLWHEFLSREFGTIARLNQAAGTNYSNFEEVSTKDNNWVVNILVARFASWLLYTYYQGQDVDAVRVHSKGAPVGTRWCEMSAAALDPRDFSRFDEINVDYPGFTWYPGNPFVLYTVKNRNLLGKATSNFSMIKFYGKPISSGELGYWRGTSADAGTDPQHDFKTMRPFRPWEFENLMYRCLYYNVGLHCLFNYTFPNDNVSWSTHAHFPDLLKAARQVIDEWDRMQPYAKFGKALPNEAGIIISRNARLFPVAGDAYRDNDYFRDPAHDTIWRAMDDHYYGNVWLAAAAIMEDPGLSYFDIMEEHAPLVTQDAINRYKGLIVYDACLTDKTRKMVESFAKSGKPVLVIGASKYVSDIYLPAAMPESYPITTIGGGQLAKCVGHFDRALNAFVYTSGNLDLSLKMAHPLLSGIEEFRILAPVEVKPAAGAMVMADYEGKPIFVVKRNVAYLSGVPYGLDVRTQLYRNFLKWCNARVHDLYISRFENAIVAQNYKSEHIRTWIDGEILKPFPQIDSITMQGAGSQLYEAKGDFPWLAFKDSKYSRDIQGIHFDTCQVRVFQKLNGPIQPHFEDCSDGLGFTQFVLGTTRVRGYFKVSRPGRYSVRFVPAMWGDRKIRWQLTQDAPLSEEILAKGEGSEIDFGVPTGGGTLYRLEIISN